MFEIKLQPRNIPRLAALSIIIFSLVLTCCLIVPCFGNPDQPINGSNKDQNLDFEKDKYSETVANIPFSTLKIKDDAVRAGLLYDLSSDAIFWEKNMHKTYPIASLTKMMVGLLVVEDINKGKIKWNTTVKVTPEATRTGGFTVSLKTGRVLSIEDLLKAAIISSGNDAAYLLAQFLGGTEAKFVNRMNARALKLGMKSTRFSNATGMPAINSIHDNRSSPSDILILCREILRHEKLMYIAGMGEASIMHGHEIIKLKNHNRLVTAFDEVDGIKTGYTRNAKFCLATTASKDYRRIITIALGADTQDSRNQFVGNLISQYYDVIGMGNLSPKMDFAKGYPKNSGSSNIKTPIFHKIQKGETLFSIANYYGCSVNQLKNWNGLKGNKIISGKQLRIYRINPSSTQSAKKSTGSTVIYYTVKPGDTLWKISQKHNGISVEKLMQLNGIKRATELKAGDIIKIVLNITSCSA